MLSKLKGMSPDELFDNFDDLVTVSGRKTIDAESLPTRRKLFNQMSQFNDSEEVPESDWEKNPFKETNEKRLPLSEAVKREKSLGTFQEQPLQERRVETEKLLELRSKSHEEDRTAKAYKGNLRKGVSFLPKKDNLRTEQKDSEDNHISQAEYENFEDFQDLVYPENLEGLPFFPYPDNIPSENAVYEDCSSVKIDDEDENVVLKIASSQKLGSQQNNSSQGEKFIHIDDYPPNKANIFMGKEINGEEKYWRGVQRQKASILDNLRQKYKSLKQKIQRNLSESELKNSKGHESSRGKILQIEQLKAYGKYHNPDKSHTASHPLLLVSEPDSQVNQTGLGQGAPLEKTQKNKMTLNAQKAKTEPFCLSTKPKEWPAVYRETEYDDPSHLKKRLLGHIGAFENDHSRSRKFITDFDDYSEEQGFNHRKRQPLLDEGYKMPGGSLTSYEKLRSIKKQSKTSEPKRDDNEIDNSGLNKPKNRTVVVADRPMYYSVDIDEDDFDERQKNCQSSLKNSKSKTNSKAKSKSKPSKPKKEASAKQAIQFLSQRQKAEGEKVHLIPTLPTNNLTENPHNYETIDSNNFHNFLTLSQTDHLRRSKSTDTEFIQKLSPSGNLPGQKKISKCEMKSKKSQFFERLDKNHKNCKSKTKSKEKDNLKHFQKQIKDLSLLSRVKKTALKVKPSFRSVNSFQNCHVKKSASMIEDIISQSGQVFAKKNTLVPAQQTASKNSKNQLGPNCFKTSRKSTQQSACRLKDFINKMDSAGKHSLRVASLKKPKPGEFGNQGLPANFQSMSRLQSLTLPQTGGLPGTNSSQHTLYLQKKGYNFNEASSTQKERLKSSKNSRLFSKSIVNGSTVLHSHDKARETKEAGRGSLEGTHKQLENNRRISGLNEPKSRKKRSKNHSISPDYCKHFEKDHFLKKKPANERSIFSPKWSMADIHEDRNESKHSGKYSAKLARKSKAKKSSKSNRLKAVKTSTNPFPFCPEARNKSLKSTKTHRSQKSQKSQEPGMTSSQKDLSKTFLSRLVSKEGCSSVLKIKSKHPRLYPSTRSFINPDNTLASTRALHSKSRTDLKLDLLSGGNPFQNMIAGLNVTGSKNFGLVPDPKKSSFILEQLASYTKQSSVGGGTASFYLPQTQRQPPEKNILEKRAVNKPPKRKTSRPKTSRRALKSARSLGKTSSKLNKSNR